MRRSAISLTVLGALAVLGLSSIFIVDERERALVLQFGQIVEVKEEPGLGFKIPLIQQVVRYDDRILSRETASLEVTPLDDRRLIVDAFARYRITDVRKFREAVGDGGLDFANQRIDSILRAVTRRVLGSVSSGDILSANRTQLMADIRNDAINEAQALGIQVIDVRLKRTDLPPANLNATYERMKAERERIAADEIARGNEAAQRARAEADRQVVQEVSAANRDADVIRGEADAERNRIFAEAFGKDPSFFDFYRSMSAYQVALGNGNATFVLSPDDDFLSFLRSDQGNSGRQ